MDWWGKRDVYTWQAVFMADGKLPPDSFEAVKKDEARFRERYWLITHQAPGITGDPDRDTARILLRQFVPWAEEKGWLESKHECR